MRPLVLAALVACGNTEAAPKTSSVTLDRSSGLCSTKGSVAPNARVVDPTVRAVKVGSSGDAATLKFTFHGATDDRRALASGQERRQLGLKLRAANGCNLVYVMWRLDPKPALDVSVKSNPGERTHEECGAGGYAKVKPAESTRVPDLVPGATHALRAEIAGDELRAFIDDRLVWRGTLPASARALHGQAGLRSDNLSYTLLAFDAPAGGAGECEAAHGD